MMAEGHCQMAVNDALFDQLVDGRDLRALLRSEAVVRELDSLGQRFETLGKAGFCEHIKALYGPKGSKLTNLISG